MSNGLPQYIKEYKKGMDQATVTRIRCGNVEKVNRYWLEEKDWTCKLCENGWSTFKHFLYECEGTKQWVEGVIEKGLDKIDIITSEKGNIEICKLFCKIKNEIRKKNDKQ